MTSEFDKVKEMAKGDYYAFLESLKTDPEKLESFLLHLGKTDPIYGLDFQCKHDSELPSYDVQKTFNNNLFFNDIIKTQHNSVSSLKKDTKNYDYLLLTLENDESPGMDSKYRILPNVKDSYNNPILETLIGLVYPDLVYETTGIEQLNSDLIKVFNFVDSNNFVNNDLLLGLQKKEVSRQIKKLCKKYKEIQLFLKKDSPKKENLMYNECFIVPDDDDIRRDRSGDPKRTELRAVIENPIGEIPWTNIDQEVHYKLSGGVKNENIFGSFDPQEARLASLNGEDSIKVCSIESMYSFYFNELYGNLHLFDTANVLFSHIPKIFPELSLIMEVKNTSLSKLNTILEKSHSKIFIGKDQAKEYIQSKLDHKINSVDIKKYILSKYEIVQDPMYSIMFTDIFNEVSSHFKLTAEYQKTIKWSLPNVLAELGLSKKRLAKGMFWYGLKTKCVGVGELERSVPITDEEIMSRLKERDSIKK